MLTAGVVERTHILKDRAAVLRPAVGLHGLEALVRPPRVGGLRKPANRQRGREADQLGERRQVFRPVASRGEVGRVQQMCVELLVERLLQR